MKVIPEPIVFDWDEGNLNKNVAKHQVLSQEAEEVFGNEPFIVVEDKSHSQDEKRFKGLGRTSGNRLLFVSFTIRNKKVRIISVRDMSHREKKNYEETK